MKKMKMFALALVLLSSCQKDEMDPASAMPGDMSSARRSDGERVTVPFKLSLSTTVDTDPSIPPTPCSGDLPGLAVPGYFFHGTASVLGLIDPDSSRGHDVTCDLSFATALLTTTVEGTLAGANGDKIYYTGNDQVDVTNLLTGAGPNGTITGVWTITGGTGRFEGATGSFAIQGLVDFATTTLQFTGIGTITF